MNFPVNNVKINDILLEYQIGDIINIGGIDRIVESVCIHSDYIEYNLTWIWEGEYKSEWFSGSKIKIFKKIGSKEQIGFNVKEEKNV